MSRKTQATDPLARAGVDYVKGRAHRNIVSLRASQNLFDDLSAEANDWAMAQAVESQARPPTYRSSSPVIDRPFEEAAWVHTIAWPFRNGSASRFSDGSFGVWYGAQSIETTVHETAHHWRHGLLRDAGFEIEGVAIERHVYAVTCTALLLDLRPAARFMREVFDPIDCTASRMLGSRIHREGHPGLLAPSVRDPDGQAYAIMNPGVLSDPRFLCALTYRIRGDHVLVERTPGRTWLTLDNA